jgi:hypothetical protein
MAQLDEDVTAMKKTSVLNNEFYAEGGHGKISESSLTFLFLFFFVLQMSIFLALLHLLCVLAFPTNVNAVSLA